MKLCIVGIGGAGGNIAKKFLRNEDLNSKLLSRIMEHSMFLPVILRESGSRQI